VEAEDGAVTKGPDGTAAILRTYDVRAILDHGEAVPRGNVHDRIHVARQPVEVCRYDRPGSWTNGSSKCFRIEREGVGIHVSEKPWTTRRAVEFIDVAFFFVPGQLGAHEGLYSLIAAGMGVPPAAGLTLSLARRIRGVFVGLGAVFAR
jgi:hypothetical protein